MMHMCDDCHEQWAQWRLTYGEGETKRIVKVCNTHYVARKDDADVKCVFAGAMPEGAA